MSRSGLIYKTEEVSTSVVDDVARALREGTAGADRHHQWSARSICRGSSQAAHPAQCAQRRTTKQRATIIAVAGRRGNVTNRHQRPVAAPTLCWAAASALADPAAARTQPGSVERPRVQAAWRRTPHRQRKPTEGKGINRAGGLCVPSAGRGGSTASCVAGPAPGDPGRASIVAG